ncbi:MAG: hypothetical protein AB7T06_25320 [Kofleriaceae bacterium]
MATSQSHPPVGIEPHNPVRDDSKLAPTEDLDRMPDGAPHRVIGMTAFFAVVFAMLVAFMLLVGSTWTRVAAIVLAAIAIPVVVSQLRKKAERERDHLHPSR